MDLLTKELHSQTFRRLVLFFKFIYLLFWQSSDAE